MFVRCSTFILLNLLSIATKLNYLKMFLRMNRIYSGYFTVEEIIEGGDKSKKKNRG